MKRVLLVLALGACAADQPQQPDYTGETRRFVVDSIAVPTTSNEAREYGADLDGDRNVENQLGSVCGLLETIGDLATHPDDMVASGVIASTVEITADDFTTDDTVGLRFIGADGDTAEIIGGALADGRFTTEWSGAGAVHVPVFIDADPTVLPLVHMQAKLVADGSGGFDATIQGAVSAEAALDATFLGLQQMFDARPADHTGFFRMIDTAPNDFEITKQEVKSSSLIASFLAPDIELDGTRMLSFGFRVHLTPCADGRCAEAAEPSCFDRVRDGDETDVDCGGSCGACAAGRACEGASDCQSNACDGTCAAPSCDNGVRDGYETDVDCGGPCGGCALGQACWSGNDCLSGQCGEPCTDVLCPMYTLDSCR